MPDRDPVLYDFRLRHVYWMRPRIGHYLDGRVSYVCFGFGRFWLDRGVVMRSPALEFFWPRFRRWGGA